MACVGYADVHTRPGRGPESRRIASRYVSAQGFAVCRREELVGRGRISSQDQSDTQRRHVSSRKTAHPGCVDQRAPYGLCLSSLRDRIAKTTRPRRRTTWGGPASARASGIALAGWLRVASKARRQSIRRIGWKTRNSAHGIDRVTECCKSEKGDIGTSSPWKLPTRNVAR